MLMLLCLLNKNSGDMWKNPRNLRKNVRFPLGPYCPHESVFCLKLFHPKKICPHISPSKKMPHLQGLPPRGESRSTWWTPRPCKHNMPIRSRARRSSILGSPSKKVFLGSKITLCQGLNSFFLRNPYNAFK